MIGEIRSSGDLIHGPMLEIAIGFAEPFSIRRRGPARGDVVEDGVEFRAFGRVMAGVNSLNFGLTSEVGRADADRESDNEESPGIPGRRGSTQKRRRSTCCHDRNPYRPYAVPLRPTGGTVDCRGARVVRAPCARECGVPASPSGGSTPSLHVGRGLDVRGGWSAWGAI